MNEDLQHDKDRLDALRAKAQEFAAAGVTARLYGPQTDGEKSSSYKGKIVAIDGDTALQELNAKGSYVYHRSEGLAVGDVVNIGYYKTARTVAPHVPGEKAERPARAPREPQDQALESNAPKAVKDGEKAARPTGSGRKPVATRKNTEPKKSVADIDGEIRRKVAERVLKSIDNGTSIWQRPWKNAAKKSRPHNFESGANYQGVNHVLLRHEMLARGSSDTRFMTYKQTQTLAAQMAKNGTPEDQLPHVRKGAESIEVVKFGRTIRKQEVLDDAGNPKRDSEGKAIVKEVRGRSFLQSFYVFHASDIENMPPLELAEPKAQWEVHAEAERLLELSGVPMRHESDNRAYYEPLLDRITMPEMVQFKNADDYYSTALHEVGHATGHASRLNREGIVEFGGFGTPSYAYEELIADTASAFTAAELGLDSDAVLASHASYLASWVEKIKEDPQALFRAFNAAEQASDFILQRHPMQLEAQAQMERERGLDHDLDMGMQHDVATPSAGTDYLAGLTAEPQEPAQQTAGMSM